MKFKVGDKVRVIRDAGFPLLKGRVGIVVCVKRGSLAEGYPYGIAFSDYQRPYGIQEWQFRGQELEEVKDER